MKFFPLLLPIAILAGLALVFLPGRHGSIESPEPTAGPIAGITDFDEFVGTVGLDTSTMSTGLRREAIISGRQRSLPLCSLSEKQADNPTSVFERYVQGVGLDVSNIGLSDSGRSVSEPVTTLDEMAR